ncbi:MAG: hypothetical protein JW939_03300 [Candidatus Thermoplasmatota archaeon]|nr:hypothetical protein [Candidatus Thermoplasmatota archaeon]
MRFSNRDIILSLAAVLLLVVTVVLGYFVFKEEDKKESDLRVEDVQFIMRGADSERSRIEIAVFISNIGNEDVSKIKIRAFTVETGSNLAMDDSSTTLTDVKHQTTVEGKLMVEIPNDDSYRMELLIFKDDRLVIRGHGTINLEDVGAPDDYRNYPSDDDDVDDEGIAPSGAAFSLLGVACVFFLIVCVIVGVIIYVSVKSGKERNKGKVLLSEGPLPPPMMRNWTEPRREEIENGPGGERSHENGPKGKAAPGLRIPDVPPPVGEDENTPAERSG